MKNLYRITNKAGRTLCFQVAKSEREAIEASRMCGHRAAAKAEYVREHF